MVYKVFHPYMTPHVEEDPLMSVHQKILEEEHARANNVVYVLPICHHIVVI